MILKSTNGYNFIIDDEDYEKVNKWNWFVDKRGYLCSSGVVSRRNGVNKIHRYILDIPKDKVVDHINGNPLDNRKSNLRICIQKYNAKNRGLNKSKIKGSYKGVGWKKANNKWQAKIRVNGRDIYLGLYESEEKGALAYNDAAYIYFGEYAKLNKINPNKLLEVLSC